MWSKRVAEQLTQMGPADVDSALACRLINSIDLTSLSDKETEADIHTLCKKAITPYGPVAAICVYPKWVSYVKSQLENDHVRIATVVNFPTGAENHHDVIAAMHETIASGADEIDVVFPYPSFLRGEKQSAANFIQQCKEACNDKAKLKVILETGAFPTLDEIAEASKIAIIAGADFLKTSTGKINVGATLEAAAAMLLVIHDMQPTVDRTLGFKASGGIREVKQAVEYMQLANQIMGDRWATANTFRLGASQLLDNILMSY